MAKKIIIRKPLDRWGNQISYVTTSSSVYDKEGNNLDQLLAKIDTKYVRKTSITQELGESEDLVMGQKGVTMEINRIDQSVVEMGSSISSLGISLKDLEERVSTLENTPAT